MEMTTFLHLQNTFMLLVKVYNGSVSTDFMRNISCTFSSAGHPDVRSRPVQPSSGHVHTSHLL